MNEIQNLNTIEKILDRGDKFFNSSAATKILRRLLIVITSPIWLSLMVVARILTFCWIGFTMLMSVPYWIVTGKDIMESKYNIFDV